MDQFDHQAAVMVQMAIIAEERRQKCASARWPVERLGSERRRAGQNEVWIETFSPLQRAIVQTS